MFVFLLPILSTFGQRHFFYSATSYSLELSTNIAFIVEIFQVNQLRQYSNILFVLQTYEKITELQELQNIITKMPLNVCCVTVLPEFGVRWREVSRAVRNARLPMISGSVARVLCQHAMKSFPGYEVDEIVARLRLKCKFYIHICLFRWIT